MSTVITVDVKENSGGWECRVIVSDRNSQAVHLVTVEKAYLARLTESPISVEILVQRSFEFLLKREPKESILRKFNLSVISRYFPEYEREISQTLRNKL